jgi:hypothetical protein
MKHFMSAVFFALSCVVAGAATIINTDADAAMLSVTEGGNRLDVMIAPGDSQTICPAGCFVTFPSGDHIALDGAETVEIVKGSAVLK